MFCIDRLQCLDKIENNQPEKYKLYYTESFALIEKFQNHCAEKTRALLSNNENYKY